MTSDDTLVAMLAVAASSRNPLLQKGKWQFETACAARDDASRYFSEGPFQILGLRFCRCVKKERNRRRGPLTLTELPDCCGRGNRGEERSTEIDPEIFKRVGVSLNPAMPVCLALRNTTIIASRSGAWAYIATWGRQSDNGKDDVGAALFYPVAEVSRTGGAALARGVRPC